MKFEDYRISEDIKKNIKDLGFKKPTDIQYKAIPPILRGEDVLAIAQTGTGKTAAFAIPIIHLIDQQKSSGSAKGIQALILVPTRELAIQITDAFETIGNNTKVNTTVVYGGVEQDRQINKLKDGADVLVATPGRMFDLINQKYIDLRYLKVLILDEADHMLDLGFIKDIRDIQRHIPRQHQTLFFSATINKSIKKLAYSLVRNPIRIQISPKNPVAKNIEHSVAFIEMDDKRFFLERVINNYPDSKVLAFVRTKIRAERVMKALERVGIKSDTIHGEKEQSDRIEVLNKFKSGKTNVLIATDVSSRGIDIPGVDYVINYDMPEQAENYVHRVGRTGRGSKKGQAVSFCSKDERILLEDIENYLDKPIGILDISKSDYLETLEISNESHTDWKTLIRDNEEMISKKKKKKKKK
ncbi:MAG: DEAD/DEAH box helicase [Lentimicrobiaceae bacterium]|jgi:ATP-dependent RNA helicase RhlE|nr:DEAD/DEAH box helicase [Lentimicrobiaceae bacterium]MCP4909543.1 DEAD/DEAH box helicase [Bacteroidota bacterium]MBT3453453.1 DEAD/DEAH box helicase [Lentimicrobiaceae bacterium]MBT3819008.1 DEAD/DEAH box helicase [Lentimicrobiaceae bacterium]MBT4060463.1 DEAD/DEAH box helicase [Lentimicrobiaceae bacterium]